MSVATWNIIKLSAAAPVLLLFAAMGAAMLCPYPASRLAKIPRQSIRFTDRNGRDLRVTTGDDAERVLWCDLDAMGPWVAQATVAIEDHRFHLHPGVDPAGIMRAAWTDIVAGRAAAGGSTLTQQLARLVRPELKRLPGWKRKMIEAWDAVRIERTLSKDEILEQYLNRAPYGNRTVGIRAAAEMYFGKSPDRLTLGEAAMLAGLPQAPDALSPYAHLDKAIRRQRIVLRRLRALGLIEEDAYTRAVGESIALRPFRAEYHAPQFVNAAREGIFGDVPGTPEIATTLDFPLQSEVEELVRNHLARLSGKRATEAAVVVMDARTGEILAYAGSSDFFGKSQVDGALALRQPGSALKPFTYALALENGHAPSELIPDVPLDDAADGFSPENFDRSFHGPVRMREALACSLNIPAVRVLRDDVGTARLLEFLRAAGFACLDRDAEHYGLALTLGAGEVRLLDLARAYAMLARGGVTVTPRAWSIDGADGARILSPEAAAQITSILSDDIARRPSFGRNSALAFPFPVAAKTGTSKDFRDNWAVGYTPRHVVAVWVGNFDSSSMIDCSGVTGAAPLMHEIMMRVGENDGPFEIPSTLVRAEVCPLSGELPGPNCPGRTVELFRVGRIPKTVCSMHAADDRIALPARFAVDGYHAY